MATLQEWILDTPAIRDEAKALWPGTIEIEAEPEYADGDQEIGGIPWNTYETVPAYLYHLEQMLKSPNPEQYYREHKPKESK